MSVLRPDHATACESPSKYRWQRAPATIFVEHPEDEANPSSVTRSPVSLTSVFLPSADGETMISSISSAQSADGFGSRAGRSQ